MKTNFLENILQILEKYNQTPLFLWEKFSDYGVFKNPDNDKWFGIIMNVKKDKLGEKTSEKIEIIDLKLDKDKIQTLLLKKRFYHAYHMNKKNWISAALDETNDDDFIMELVEESFNLLK